MRRHVSVNSNGISWCLIHFSAHTDRKKIKNNTLCFFFRPSVRLEREITTTYVGVVQWKKTKKQPASRWAGPSFVEAFFLFLKKRDKKKEVEEEKILLLLLLSFIWSSSRFPSGTLRVIRTLKHEFGCFFPVRCVYTVLLSVLCRGKLRAIRVVLPWRRNAIARRPSPSSNPRAASRKMSSSTGAFFILA